MATLSIGFIKSKPNSDGSYTLKIVINTTSKTAYISTRYKIQPQTVERRACRKAPGRGLYQQATKKAFVGVRGYI